MTEPNIRPARVTDVAAITAIYRPAVLTGTASFETEPPDVAEMQRRFEAIVGAGYPYLVAELGGQIAGYAYANAYRTRPAYRHTVENSIYVDPARQNAGIGRQLLAALLDEATRRGFRQMIAVIGDSRNEGSIRLHRAGGFAFVGTLHSVGFKHGRWLDSVLMQKALGDGDGAPPG